MTHIDYNKYVTSGTWIIEQYIYRPIIFFILKKIKDKIHPNILTLCSLSLTIISALLIVNWYIIIWAILYMFFPIVDLLDWAVARIYKKWSTFGAFFDWFVDFFSEIIILLSLWYYFGEFWYFLFLVAFGLFITYFWTRFKHIYWIKERQINFFDETKNIPKFILIILTRNDTRKLFIVLFVLLNNRQAVLIYFWILYLLALWNTSKELLNDLIKK